MFQLHDLELEFASSGNELVDKKDAALIAAYYDFLIHSKYFGKLYTTEIKAELKDDIIRFHDNLFELCYLK